MKKQFRVYVESSSILYTDVEAENEEQAKELAYDIDGGEFISLVENDIWEITGAKEIKG